MNEKTNIKFIPPLKRICMTIGELPSSYLESMTYYEMLLWFTGFLQNTLIPSINNNAKAVEELQTLYIELKNYVDNYFDNLDIQTEVNNKIEEMVDDGRLQEMITQYLEINGVLAFNTPNNLKNATNLIDGSICRTLGFTSYEDGEGAYYKIRQLTSSDIIDDINILSLTNYPSLIAERIKNNKIIHFDIINDMKSSNGLINGNVCETLGFHTINDFGGSLYKIRNKNENDIIDEIKIISLSNNNLIAELIETSEMFVEQYGAYGDGTHDDFDSIQYAINNHLFGSINFSEKEYLISNTLKTYIDNSKQSSLIMKKTTVIKTNENLEAIIELGGLGGDNNSVNNRLRILQGGIIDANNCTCGIKINENAIGNLITDCEIKRFTTYGIYAPAGQTLYSSDLSIRNCYINGKSSVNLCYGIYIERPDNKFDNLRINAIKEAMYFSKGGQFINNVHGLGIGYTDNNDWFNDTIFIHLHDGGLNEITNCYCDTLQTIVKCDTSGDFTFTNSVYYSYINNVDTKLFILNSDISRFNISNNTFQMPTPVNKHRGIIFNTFSNMISMRVGRCIISNNLFISSNDFINGDLIFRNNESYTPFWLNTGRELTNNSWLKIGYIISGLHYYDFNLNIEGYKFNANFKVERYGTSTYLTQKTSFKTNNNVSIKIGVKYENNINGYNVYGLYIQQSSGTLLKTDINISQNNKNTAFIPYNINLSDPNFETITMDSSYTV